MPITFGSVGDIIAVSLIVKDLVEALDKARGSKAEYQAAIRELWILDRTLLEIDLLIRTHGNGSTPELTSLCATAKQAAIRCRDIAEAFLDRVRKYKRTFDAGQEPNVLQEAAMKIRWRMGEKEALDKFRAEVAATSSSLQMLLATASVTLIGISRREFSDKFDHAEQQNETSTAMQDTTLTHIKNRIEHANQGIDAGNSILGQISQALRMDWLRQLGTELKSLMRRAIAMNIATYHAVVSIQRSLPSRLERGLIEEPFILEDPLGRIAPVHLQFITSWDAFNAVLEIRFRSIQGHSKIKRKQYGLQNKATGNEVDQSRSWQTAFLPGQRIEMSFIFENSDQGDQNHDNVTCPGCHVPSPDTTDADIHCENCAMWFRRITVIEDVEPPRQTPLPQPWTSKPKFGKSNLTVRLSGPLTAGRKRTAPDDLEGEEGISEFKRVRLLSKKKRVKQRHFGIASGKYTYTTFSSLPKDRSRVLPESSSVQPPVWFMNMSGWRESTLNKSHAPVEYKLPSPETTTQSTITQATIAQSTTTQETGPRDGEYKEEYEEYESGQKDFEDEKDGQETIGWRYCPEYNISPEATRYICPRILYVPSGLTPGYRLAETDEIEEGCHRGNITENEPVSSSVRQKMFAQAKVNVFEISQQRV